LLSDRQLSACTGASLNDAVKWLDPITSAMAVFSINSPKRIAAFLAQIGHESQNLRRTREIWGPTAAQLGYEGRKDLGNHRPGDGRKYMGHGLIQITGRANHAACTVGLRKYMQCPDFEQSPELLEEIPQWAAMSACWFWTDYKKLNAYADSDDFVGITRRINGGTNGWKERGELWEAGKLALGVE